MSIDRKMPLTSPNHTQMVGDSMSTFNLQSLGKSLSSANFQALGSQLAAGPVTPAPAVQPSQAASTPTAATPGK